MLRTRRCSTRASICPGRARRRPRSPPTPHVWSSRSPRPKSRSRRSVGGSRKVTSLCWRITEVICPSRRAGAPQGRAHVLQHGGQGPCPPLNLPTSRPLGETRLATTGGPRKASGTGQTAAGSLRETSWANANAERAARCRYSSRRRGPRIATAGSSRRLSTTSCRSCAAPPPPPIPDEPPVGRKIVGRSLISRAWGGWRKQVSQKRNSYAHSTDRVRPPATRS